MACSINGFRPEFSWSLVFIKHRSGHLNECSVLAFDDAILLWRVRGREFMCDAQGIKICIKASVLEFSAIVTSDVLDLDAIVIHCSIGKESEDILHFSLVEGYVHPSISRIIINNDKAIEISSSSKS